jgi:hypothetical protein
MPHPQPARLPVAPLPSTPTEIEQLVGQLVAAAVGALAAAVQEFNNGGAEPGTKLTVADRIAELVMLRAATAGEIVDFEATARTHALALLRKHCGESVSDALLATLVDDVLRLVDKVTRTQIH